jgi:UDP-N-acetylglucosamine:LPS N-acetylglucosamine transferase
MHLMRPAWAELKRAWVTHDKEDARSLLAGESVFFAYGPTTRNLVNLCRNIVFAYRLLRRLRPKAIVTAGAGIAVPFAWLARFFGTKVVYVESVTRIESPSMTYRLIAPFTDRVYVQWPQLAQKVPRSRYVGRVVGSS